MTSARPQHGALCSRTVFIRLSRTLHTVSSRPISLHAAPRNARAMRGARARAREGDCHVLALFRSDRMPPGFDWTIANTLCSNLE